MIARLLMVKIAQHCMFVCIKKCESSYGMYYDEVTKHFHASNSFKPN